MSQVLVTLHVPEPVRGPARSGRARPHQPLLEWGAVSLRLAPRGEWRSERCLGPGTPLSKHLGLRVAPD